MIFTAYLDESGTHAGAPISAMGRFVGDARQWHKFEKRAEKLFKRFRVDIFHAIEVRRGHKDFKGWTVDRKIEFNDEFQHIINETLESGVVAFIRDEDYRYYLALNWPKKTRWDSKYTLMFRACLAQIVDVVGHIPQAKEPQTACCFGIIVEADYKITTIPISQRQNGTNDFRNTIRRVRADPTFNLYVQTFGGPRNETIDLGLVNIHDFLPCQRQGQ